MLSSLLSRDHVTYLNPPLSTTLLFIADHLTDTDTAKLPVAMFEQHDLSPTSPDWLANWEMLLLNPTLLSHSRPMTRHAVMHSLQSVYDPVKDMPSYRKPLSNLVFDFCQRQVAVRDGDDEAMWSILGDEVVLRTVEAQEVNDEAQTPEIIEKDKAIVESMIELLTAIAKEGDDDDDSTTAVAADAHTPPPATASSTPSPNTHRIQSDPGRDQESGMPSVMSILASLATGNSSRSQSVQPSTEDPVLETPISPPPERFPLSRTVSAAAALVFIFSQFSFTPFSLSETNLNLAVRLYDILLNIIAEGRSARARLAVLQFLMRLRADRDHRLYIVDAAYDPDRHIWNLASLIDRVRDSSSNESTGDHFDIRRARPRFPQRRTSRGGAARTSLSTSSRSRSRLPASAMPSPSPALPKAREPIWQLPESLPFIIPEVNTPSEALVSYAPVSPDNKVVLPISLYLLTIVGIIGKEKNWEILSYILCHLPVQLANKHLFCGPKSREVISKLHATLSTGIINGQLACEVDRWPQGYKPRDAQSLAYHTLSVLLSYRRCFDAKHRHLLVEVFETGLNAQPSTIKCCLHALTLAAFEFPTSMTKSLSRILEKLSQIMSNPDMAVHILGFLSIVCSVAPLHANFTEADFKMVFGVALQYLQHHNQPGLSPTKSWALSQHVRIVSFYVLYAWFLAVRLPDRPHHIRFITRQLLLANEGRDRIDDATEVCFDWLARYTYATTDPRPANSLLNDIVMNPTNREESSENALVEKSWVSGNSIVTIRTLARLGWIELVSRRPCGLTKFLCRVENVPMVGPGDVNPDNLSMPASLIMERDRPTVQTADSNTSEQNQSRVCIAKFWCVLG
jgi:tuberous sclerosis protein 2